MRRRLWSWPRSMFRRRLKPRPRLTHWRRLVLDRLEDRTLLSGDTLLNPTVLPFLAFNSSQASGYLPTPNAVDLYSVHLQAGDRINVAISAQSSGSGLQSALRIFDPEGHQLASAEPKGGDPQLTFQAAFESEYFI